MSVPPFLHVYFFSSAVQNTVGMLLNNLSFFYWNILPAGAAPNVSLTYWYLPNGQENVIKYDFSLSLRLWYPEVAPVSMRYLTLVSLRSMSFSIGPLWIATINTLFNYIRSRHSLTFLLALGSKMKLLHYYYILWTLNRTRICCICSHSSIAFSDFCKA